MVGNNVVPLVIFAVDYSSRYWKVIYVHIEDAHKDRDLNAVAFEILILVCLFNCHNLAVCGRNYQIVVHYCHPLGTSEEVDHKQEEHKAYGSANLESKAPLQNEIEN